LEESGQEIQFENNRSSDGVDHGSENFSAEECFDVRFQNRNGQSQMGFSQPGVSSDLDFYFKNPYNSNSNQSTYRNNYAVPFTNGKPQTFQHQPRQNFNGVPVANQRVQTYSYSNQRPGFNQHGQFDNNHPNQLNLQGNQNSGFGALHQNRSTNNYQQFPQIPPNVQNFQQGQPVMQPVHPGPNIIPPFNRTTSGSVPAGQGQTNQVMGVGQQYAKPFVRPPRCCWNCGSNEHNFRNCPIAQTHIFCFRCGLNGALTNQCPQCLQGNGSRGTAQ
jgi:hypothetical protein